MLIDSHCHLSYPGLHENIVKVLERARTPEAGGGGGVSVGRLITIGTHVEDHVRTLSIAREYPQVFAALGIHPHHAAETVEGYEAFLEHHLKTEPKVVALGECGLDYHYNFSPRALQKGIFLDQLEMARRLGLPVILHVREAHADAIDILRSFPELKFVVHCFTGTPAECEAWLTLGAYIGITGIVTYKNAGDVQAAAKMVPAEKLLVETDAPYLSPEPVRKIKTNEPSHVVHTARFVAGLRGVPLEELARQTTANAATLFGAKLLA